MRNTTRDNILYLVIALGIVGVLGLVVWYQEAHGLPIRMPISDRLFGVVVTTAVVFGYAIQSQRKAWRRGRFWVVITILFAVYLPLQWRLSQFTGTRIGVASLSAVVELFLVIFILNIVLARHK